MDTARADAKAQQAYAQVVETVVAEFRHDHPELSHKDAHAAVALCVGDLLVGAACGEQAVGNRVARAARSVVSELLQNQRRIA